ncbi:general transcriptional adaptator [Enterospora canceri]|uniref:General transcriptional adaptator n=1 Tax=Enterospora canceri TaxID=1081671 RepID=A0A1Y1S9J8_9MICR|nr:general transcriptional adaptator [Enterospora canceri]
MATTKDFDNKQIVFYCDGCFRKITNNEFITCDTCDFDMCLHCFKNRIETESHNTKHKYRTVSHLDKEMESGWTIIENLLFVSGLISFGIGNWYDISFMLPSKTETEIKEHFYNMTGIRNRTTGETTQSQIGIKSEPNDVNLVNYMPLRRDFEVEQYNEFESLLQHTQYEDNETEMIKQLKNHIYYYTPVVIKQRSIWNEFVISRDLVKVDELNAKDQTPFGFFVSKYKWLAQILSKHDFNVVVSNFFKETRMKEQLKHLSESEINKMERLLNFDNVLGKEEKALCIKLRLGISEYIKLKRLALEMFAAKKMLKGCFHSIFKEKDRDRADILYKWFVINGVVIE